MSVAQPQRSRMTCALRPAHGVLAPNAKLRALVVPQEVPQGPEPAAQAAQPAECKANCEGGKFGSSGQFVGDLQPF